MEFDVNYEPREVEVPAKSANVTLWAGILVCFAVLTLTVAIFIRFLDRPDRSRATVPPATQSVAAPVTPDRISPALVNEQSPRTPQPFIDYVRRTIDETPNYRREGRRFNPQNTY